MYKTNLVLRIESERPGKNEYPITVMLVCFMIFVEDDP